MRGWVQAATGRSTAPTGATAAVRRGPMPNAVSATRTAKAAHGVTSLLSVIRYKQRQMRAGIPRSALTVAVAAVSFAVVLTACGSSGKSGSGSGSATASAGIKFADCMRAHGVPNFPDPSAGGGIQLSGGINPRSPAFQSAQSACQKLMPGGGAGRGGGSEARKEQMVKLAECMRAHGLTTFPDPTTSQPSAPPAGGGIAFGSPGGFLSIPGSMLESPAFKQAAATCSFPGFGRGNGPKPAAASGG
jgi:hypothetical protein